jgi:hypothetical protein
MARPWPTPLLLFIASAALWLAAAWTWQSTRPQFGQGTVEFAGQLPRAFAYPLEQKKAPKARFVVVQDLEVGLCYPKVFAIYPEDALWGIKVNGHAIEAPGLPLSVVHHEGRSIDMGRYLHPGINRLEFEMEAYWGEAQLHLYASPLDWISIGLAVLVLLAVAASGALLLRLGRVQMPPTEAMLLLAGFLLRYLYVSGTPHFVRAYDWWGHEAYLDYVAQHAALPDARTGWENFQPPFYYLLVGELTRLLHLAGEERYAVWQAFSLMCSSGVLIAGAWIARILYPLEVKWRLYLLAVIAVAPPLVFNASRVSNDVLLSLLEFVWLGLLLRFWQQPAWRWWIRLAVVVGFALLTKANALALVPIGLAGLLFTPRMETRFKLHAALVFVLVTGAMAGGYYAGRFGHETGVDSFVVGNIHQLNPKGHIDGIFAKSFIFNPFRVLRYPFADPWGPRREYFLEYFFRSIFLGESLGATYRWIARIYLLTALIVSPLVLLGLVRSMRARIANDVPLLATTFFIFFAQWLFVQIAPYTSSQDFRFSVLLLVPFVHFYLKGLSTLPGKWRVAASLALQLLVLNSAVYLLEVSLEG